MKPGDWLNHLTVYKTPWEKHSLEEQKTYLPFIVNLWLSMCPELIEIISDVQKYQVSNKHHYNLYLKVLPKKKLYYRWIKAKKNNYSEDVIDLLASFYKTSTREISDSLDILDEQKIKSILSNMGINDKEQIKLLK